MIKHRSIYEPEGIEEGFKVLAMRRWPRGKRKSICDLWLPTLGPTDKTLDQYRSRAISWQEFLHRYRAETSELAKDEIEMAQLAEKEHGTVTLLCWERSNAEGQLRCHRVELKDMLEQARKGRSSITV